MQYNIIVPSESGGRRGVHTYIQVVNDVRNEGHTQIAHYTILVHQTVMQACVRARLTLHELPYLYKVM